VAADYQFRLERSMEAAGTPYRKFIEQEFERMTGLKSGQDL
jgi:hypothetical protein